MTFEDDDSALEEFMVEAAEVLGEMEAGLLALEQDTTDVESINSVFRAVHTVKGSAGLFGLQAVVQFAHVVESVLDRLRGQEIPVTAELIGILLPTKDHLGDLIASVAAGSGGDGSEPEQVVTGAFLLARLDPYLEARTTAVPEQETGLASTDLEPGPDPTTARLLQLHLRFGPESLRNGLDPLAFVRYLSTRGEVTAVTTLTDRLPAAEELDPEQCHLAFEVLLLTEEPAEAIAELFDFVREDGDIQVDEVPVETSAPERRSESATDRPALRSSAERGSGENQSLRVDAGRLDRLIETVGELVIAGAGAQLRAAMSRDQSLRAALSDVMRLVEEVRDSSLQLRMVPIGNTFSRFQRVVRDVSAGLGKDVALTVTGGDTEVDKALVEQISDPLTHLVRNALDHGIEPAEVRLARGKPSQGSLQLNAFHDSGSIVIEVRDDGGGIDPERVLAKAVEAGLVAPQASPSPKEIYGLIFEPGFSTAETVSDLSGRGVGMDVVKQNVTELRGTIEVDSRPGHGTTVRIRLPLTLAIIDGFLVEVGSATFVVPLERVIECVELPAERRDHDYMGLRGQVLPLIRLRSLFAVPSNRPRRENVVVVESAGTTIGLVVDGLRGEFQTVIKPLGALFAGVPGIGGSTILGNGDVALIIDVPTLVQHAERRRRPHLSTA